MRDAVSAQRITDHYPAVTVKAARQIAAAIEHPAASPESRHTGTLPEPSSWPEIASPPAAAMGTLMRKTDPHQ